MWIAHVSVLNMSLVLEVIPAKKKSIVLTDRFNRSDNYLHSVINCTRIKLTSNMDIKNIYCGHWLLFFASTTFL
jgi:hypothetical protein